MSEENVIKLPHLVSDKKVRELIDWVDNLTIGELETLKAKYDEWLSTSSTQKNIENLNDEKPRTV